MTRKVNDLVGREYGKLLVQARLDSRQDGSVLWQCMCECGNVVHITTRHLNRKTNNVRSCGCAQHKSGAQHPSWKGVGDISGQWWNRITRRNHKQPKRRLLEVTIDQQYAWELYQKQDKRCALSGVPIVISSNNNLNTASLDRIDSSRGYVPDNVQWVHKMINIMKNDFDQSEFIAMCVAVAKTTGACPIR